MEFNYVRAKEASINVLTFAGVRRWFRDIRDELVEFNRAKKLHYPEKLRAVANAHHYMITPDFRLGQKTDGIAHSSFLRFAVAKDIRPDRGQQTIFYATDSENLETQEDENGQRTFTGDQGRYVAATLPANASTREIRNEIERTVMDFSDFGTNCMTLHGGDLTALNQTTDSIGRLRNQKVYGYTNDQFCITVRQNAGKRGGGWSLKISKPFSDSDDKSYTTSDNIDPQMAWMKTMLSNGAVYDTYKTKEEALAHMHMFKNEALQLVWQHKEPVNFKSSPSRTAIRMLTFATSSMSRFLNKEWNFQNVKEAIFDAGWTVGSFLAARFVFNTAVAGVASISLPATIAGIIAFNYGVRKFKDVTFNAMDNIKLALGGPKAFFGLAGDYVDPSIENMRRDINPKPNQAVNGHLHVLGGNELDVTYSDDQQRSPVEQQKVRRKRTSQPVSALSKDAHYIDRYTSTTMIFNGLSCLNHWDPDKKIRTSYYKLTGATNLNEHIQLSDKDREALESGRIVKHVHEKGVKTISETNVAFSRMKRDLQSRLFKIHDENLDVAPTEKREQQAFDHIQWLFNNQAANAGNAGNAGNDNKPEACAPEACETPQDSESASIDHDDRLSPTSKAKQHMEALKMAFGDRAIDIAPPSKELIEFYKGCVLPDMSWVAATP